MTGKSVSVFAIIRGYQCIKATQQNLSQDVALVIAEACLCSMANAADARERHLTLTKAGALASAVELCAKANATVTRGFSGRDFEALGLSPRSIATGARPKLLRPTTLISI